MKEANSYQLEFCIPRQNITEERLTCQGFPRISAGSLTDTPHYSQGNAGCQRNSVKFREDFQALLRQWPESCSGWESVPPGIAFSGPTISDIIYQYRRRVVGQCRTHSCGRKTTRPSTYRGNLDTLSGDYFSIRVGLFLISAQQAFVTLEAGKQTTATERAYIPKGQI